MRTKNPPGAQAKVGQPVAMAVGDTFDHSAETEATERVSHPTLCQVSRLLAE